MSIFFCYNHKIYNEGEAIVGADNRSLRYGDGLFETMKMINGEIILKDYHFERLFSGMQVLKFQIQPHFTSIFLEDQVKQLCKKNGHGKNARVRLMIFRGKGGLYDVENSDPNYIIQSWNIQHSTKLNANGLIADVYPDVKKSCDKFSNLKNNNFLPYIMGALYAKENKLNDCLLLNTYERICDSTIANIFIVKDGIISTPLLTEGCIAGVMRRWLIQNFPPAFKISETPLSQQDLKTADEIFLTNSIYDLRWVQQVGDTKFNCDLIVKIHKHFIQTIY